MDNILAAKVLISHIPEITDGAYKTATEIAIETLFHDASLEWEKHYSELTILEYLEITSEEYDYWMNGQRRWNKDFKWSLL